MIFDQIPMGIRQGALSRLLTSRPLLTSSRPAVFLPLLLALCLALSISFVACSDVSPAFGQYYKGRTLHLNVVTLDRAAELLYFTVDTAQVTRHFRIRPSEENLELVLIRVKVENHTATSAIVNIDGQAAEIRDFSQGKYFPINVNDRWEEVAPLPKETRPWWPFWGVPANPADERCARPPRYQGDEECFVFLWNDSVDGVSKAFVLQKGHGIDGLMVFEAPKDTKFRTFKWRAGDTLSIDF